MPDPATPVAADDADRDCFRRAVATLPPGPLRDLLTAVAYARARKGPAFVHAHCVRPYSHSLSDDERFYKTEAERIYAARHRKPEAVLAETAVMDF